MPAARVTLALVALALVAPALAAPAPPALEFAPPAQAEGGVVAEDLHWALLLFKGGHGRFHVELPAGATATNHTRWVVEAGGSFLGPDPSDPLSRSKALPGPLAADVTPGGGWSSLLVVADRLWLDAGAANGSFREGATGSVPAQQLPSGEWPRTALRNTHAFPAPQVSLGLLPAEGAWVGLRAEGVRTLVWHNVSVACPASPCPDGAGVAGIDHSLPGGRVRVQRFFHTELASAGGTLVGAGTARVLAAGGPEVSLAIHGSIRLPLASLLEPCAECIDPAGGTLQATGNLTLAALAPAEGGKLRARVAGLDSVRIDEGLLSVPVATAVAAAGSVALLALLARAVAWLVVHTRVEDALENPRRRALYERILAQPELSFRELQRQTGWGIGTMVHHLRLLARGGHVVAQPYGRTVRYFENHGRYRESWRAVAVLADARLVGLHEWLLGHAGASQREVVRHARAAWGWGRSATQDRLQALVREGLAEARLEGRRARYVARRPQAPMAAPLGAS